MEFFKRKPKKDLNITLEQIFELADRKKLVVLKKTKHT